jgi:hypothetical protein
MTSWATPLDIENIGKIFHYVISSDYQNISLKENLIMSPEEMVSRACETGQKFLDGELFHYPG